MDILTALTMLSKYKPKLKVEDDHWIFSKMPKEFTPNKEINVLGIQTSKDSLNINLFCKIDGTISIDATEYETYSFISIPVVKVGVVSVSELRLKFKDEDIEYFLTLSEETDMYDEFLLPIINKQPIDFTNMAAINYEEYQSNIGDLCSLIAKAIKLEIQTKSMKFVVGPDEVKSNNHNLPDVFNNDGSLKLVQSSSAKKPQSLFDTKIKKMTIPSMNSVLKKNAEGKKLNAPDTLMLKSYNKYTDEYGTDVLIEMLSTTEGELKDIRSKIMLIKATHEHLSIPLVNTPTDVTIDMHIMGDNVPVVIELNPLISIMDEE